MGPYDIVFVGHLYRDLIRRGTNDPVSVPGGSVVYGAMAAARLGMRVRVVTKMAEKDRDLLEVLEREGIGCTVIASEVTGQFEVIYPGHDDGERVIYQRGRAPGFAVEDIPPITAPAVHLAGNADGEFSPEFVAAMRHDGRRVGVDMQAFVRQLGSNSDRVAFRDVQQKREVAAAVDIMKMDALEATILTGEDNPRRALVAASLWGCPEILLTINDGVFCRCEGATSFVRFTNRSSVGRNGRGDTTTAAYVCRRLTHGPVDSLRYAAAVASIKLEKQGPFSGTPDEVEVRMRALRVE